jgi:exodeoxyribonuclease VII small subunit
MKQGVNGGVVAKAGKPSYASLSAELAEIIAWFENGEADLDEAIVKYEQASKLIKQLEDYLKTTENKIEKITLTEL